MAKKKFNRRSNYYSSQQWITEANRIKKQTRHNENHPNDTIKHKNPQFSKEVIEANKLNKLNK